MGSKSETIIFIVALACALIAVDRTDGGLLTSVLLGGGVALAVAVVGLVVVRVTAGRRSA